ncbi:MAG: response regulator transcription factor [Planctomycetaceae bacterium]|nr:response regulator transcription factor [Planctomycetaceae bacterium]
MKGNFESANQKMRVLVVDDHPIVREGISAVINREQDLEVVGQASGLAEAMRLHREMQPDIVVADVSLADGNGLELVKELVAQNADTRVLVQSMHEESLYAERSLRAGARGYINKEESSTQLINAIRHVLNGRVYLSSRMTDRLLNRSVRGVDAARSPIESLSDRELEVFEQIGRGMTTRRIAQNLYLSPKTIETYRENIKAKLSLRNATELTQHAVQWVLDNRTGEDSRPTGETAEVEPAESVNRTEAEA